MQLLIRGRSRRRLLTPQMLKVMKLTFFLLTAAFLQISARSVSQTVTFSGKDVSLQTVFDVVTQQSGYTVFCNYEILRNAKKVTINLKNADIETAMKETLRGQTLTYTIVEKTIIVKPATTSEVKTTDNAVDALRGFFPPPPIDVKGKVVNENGEPVVGASVKVKGTNIGTTTDVNGEFVLNGIDEKATLVFSGTNIESFEQKVNGRSSFDLTAKIKVGSLNEVVINKGYYTEKQRLSVSNVGKVTAKDIEKQPVQNPLLALQGRVPGIEITQSNGIPGGGIRVRIQGINSIANGNEPFYVIDGVPYQSQTLSTTSPTGVGILGSSSGPVGSGGGNPLNYINPGDIESIEVLKDADATAIYGSRAANGAILITTKKGKAGKTKVDFNLQSGWGQVQKKLDLLTTQQYIEMRKEAYLNDGVAIPARNPAATNNYDLTIWDSTRYTDWQEVLLGGSANYTTVNGSVSGGSTNTQFIIGATFHKETTVFPKDFADQKGSLHFNLNNTSSNQKFKIQLSTTYMVDKNELPNTDLTDAALRLSPNAPEIYNSDGTLNWQPNSNGTSTWTNPMSYLDVIYENKANNLISNLTFSYGIIRGLVFKSSFGYNNLQISEFTGRPLSSFKPELRPNSTRSAQFTNSKSSSWVVEPQLTYNLITTKGKIEALIGATIQQNTNNGDFFLGTGFISDVLMRNIQAAPTVQARATAVSQYKYNAIFGRLNYNFADKYIINFTGRRDGSSRFGSKNQFNNFGAIGAAWIFSEESLIKNAIRFLSFGKIRSSIGTTGNDQIGDYSFMNLYLPISSAVPFQNSGSLEPRRLPNEYLQWEKTKKIQVGVDLGFFTDRIMISSNYVLNRSSNQLLQYNLPTITGFQSILDNFPATVQNSALEFQVSTINIDKNDFKWTSSFNVTIPKNKLLAFQDLNKSSYGSFLIIGEPTLLLKLYDFADVDPTTGKYRFSDGKGGLTTRPDTIATLSKTALFRGNTKFYGGLQNTLRIKGLQIDFFFQFAKQVGKKYLFNSSNPPGVFLNGAGFGNQPNNVLNRWQKAGDNTNFQKFSQNGSLIDELSNVEGSNQYYDDASFIRLKNVSIGYDLPNQSIQKLGIQSSQIYIQGQNLITISKYSGLDPENRSVNSLPPLRVITVGLRLGF